MPVGVEQQLGATVKPQILASLSGGKAAKLCTAPAGSAALQKLVAPYLAVAQTPLPVTIEVVDVGVPNAFALPGGHILVLRGLIDKVETPEQLAGVIAHELGHVAHRDGRPRPVEVRRALDRHRRRHR